MPEKRAVSPPGYGEGRLGERRRELDRAGERRVPGGEPREHPRRPVIARGEDAERRRRLEAEPRVVLRVPEQEHERLAELVGAPQRLAGERAADAAPLLPGRDAQRAELQRTQLAHPHAGQHRVAEDRAVLLPDERDVGRGAADDAHRLLFAVERGVGDGDDRDEVGGRRVADHAAASSRATEVNAYPSSPHAVIHSVNGAGSRSTLSAYPCVEIHLLRWIPIEAIFLGGESNQTPVSPSNVVAASENAESVFAMLSSSIRQYCFTSWPCRDRSRIG